MEFLVVDKRTFLTDKEHALQMLFGEANDVQEMFNAEIVSISDRIATAFASLKVGFTSALPAAHEVCFSSVYTGIFKILPDFID